MIACGVDPGSSTGLVCVEVPDNGQLVGGRWLNSTVLRADGDENLTAPSRDAGFCDRIAGWLATMEPALVVFEEPVDAKPFWGGGRKGFRTAGTGSGFRSGCYYGLAVAATRCLARARLASYPVHAFRGRPGWMPGGKTGRGKAIGQSATLARHLRAPLEVFALTPDGAYRHDHLFMALGVLAFHLAQARPLARAAAG